MVAVYSFFKTCLALYSSLCTMIMCISCATSTYQHVNSLRHRPMCVESLLENNHATYSF